MQAVIKRIDSIIKELYQIQRTIKALSVLNEDPKEWEYNQYILHDKDGNVVMQGTQTQVRNVAGMSCVKFKKMLEDGSEYNGYTIDEVIEEE